MSKAQILKKIDWNANLGTCSSGWIFVPLSARLVFSCSLGFSCTGMSMLAVSEVLIGSCSIFGWLDSSFCRLASSFKDLVGVTPNGASESDVSPLQCMEGDVFSSFSPGKATLSFTISFAVAVMLKLRRRELGRVGVGFGSRRFRFRDLDSVGVLPAWNRRLLTGMEMPFCFKKMESSRIIAIWFTWSLVGKLPINELLLTWKIK